MTYCLQLILDSCLLEQIIKKMYSIAQEVTKHSELYLIEQLVQCYLVVTLLGMSGFVRDHSYSVSSLLMKIPKNRFLFLQIIIDNYDTFLKPKFLFCNKDVTRIPGV